MRMIIHDLGSDVKLNNIDLVNDLVVSNAQFNCCGCFNCWINNPFKCVFNDNIRENGKDLFNSTELVIISKCFYGGYSSKVKKILERTISYVYPFFTIRNEEIHHMSRTNRKLKFKVYFYGDNITREERDIAKKLVVANSFNLNTLEPVVSFVNDYKEIYL